MEMRGIEGSSSKEMFVGGGCCSIGFMKTEIRCIGYLSDTLSDKEVFNWVWDMSKSDTCSRSIVLGVN